MADEASFLSQLVQFHCTQILSKDLQISVLFILFSFAIAIKLIGFFLQDPEAKKPDDWDEREKIDDPDDKKPEDWDKPEHIPDPDAKKPDDWDDEMDGEWEPPMIDNPEYKVCSGLLHSFKWTFSVL